MEEKNVDSKRVRKQWIGKEEKQDIGMKRGYRKKKKRKKNRKTEERKIER